MCYWHVEIAELWHVPPFTSRNAEQELIDVGLISRNLSCSCVLFHGSGRAGEILNIDSLFSCDLIAVGGFLFI